MILPRPPREVWVGVCGLSYNVDKEVSCLPVKQKSSTFVDVIPVMTRSVADIAFTSDFLTDGEYKFWGEQNEILSYFVKKRAHLPVLDELSIFLIKPSVDCEERDKLKELDQVLPQYFSANRDDDVSTVYLTSPTELVSNSISITIPVGVRKGKPFERYGLTVSSPIETDLTLSLRRALRVSFFLEQLFRYDQYPIFSGLSY